MTGSARCLQGQSRMWCEPWHFLFGAHHIQSTIAQSFAADLDSMFGLSPEVDGLTQTLEAKYDALLHAISSDN